MNKIALYALFSVLVGWGLTSMTGMHLLSGSFDDRTCQTACVQGYFFAAVVFGIAGFGISLFALTRSSGRTLSTLALLASVPLCGLFGALYFMGNYA